ncbi:hypothetical protein B0H14DRAFT_3161295 [Mycena olivaceomarginata]|nr:hypothetical protein B0H14DRAFT_3161295 [Mycena olivaceomarginata]
MPNGEHSLLHHTVRLMDDAETVIPISSNSSGSVGGLCYPLNSDVVYDILTPVHLVIFVNNWDPTQMTVYPHEAHGLNVLPSLMVHDFHNKLRAVRFNTNIIGQVYLKYTNTWMSQMWEIGIPLTCPNHIIFIRLYKAISADINGFFETLFCSILLHFFIWTKYFNTQLEISSPAFTLAFATRLPLYKFTFPLSPTNLYLHPYSPRLPSAMIPSKLRLPSYYIATSYAAVHKHLRVHSKDKDSKFCVILIKARIHRLLEREQRGINGEALNIAGMWDGTKGSIPSSLSFKEAVINSCPMLEEGPHSKSVCEAASRKGDVGVNERNERSYNLDIDRRWKE